MASKGHRNEGETISEYSDRFLEGWVIKYWDKIMEQINAAKDGANKEEK